MSGAPAEPRRIGVVLAVSRQRITVADVQASDPFTDVRDVGDADGGPVHGIADAEVLVGNPSAARFAELVDRMPRLRWFHAAGAGVDRYVPTLVRRPEVTITRAVGLHALPMAEFTVATIFAVEKRLPLLRDHQNARDWPGGKARLEARDVAGRTVCVIGVGAVGSEVARLASACGMRVVGVRRHPDPVPGVSRMLPPERLLDAVAGADHVVVACALTPETDGLIDARVLAAMKPDAWLINVARGAIVDEAALWDALARKAIAGAALDTLWTEPLPPDSRWWTLENVLITYHRSGSSDTHRRRLVTQFAEQLRRYRAGEPVEEVVDVARGY